MRLKELRQEANISIRQLSAYTGIAASTLSSIENGKRNITPLQIRSLADFFHVSCDYLLGKSDEGITVYNEYDDVYYKISFDEYTKFKEQDAIELRLFENHFILHFGNYTEPNHTLIRVVKEEFGADLYEKLEEDFDSTISNLSPSEKQEILEYLKNK